MQGIVVNCLFSAWKDVVIRVTVLEFVLGPILFNILISGLGKDA